MRVLTMNIWGIRGDWPRRRKVLADGFGELRPDLVALQESIVTDDYDQVRDLFDDGYHVEHQRGREPDGQGVSLATRWPMREVTELDLQLGERTADFACTTLLAEVASSHPDQPGHTFTPRNALMTAPDWPFSRIDYIMVRREPSGAPGLTVRDCRLAFDQPVGGVWASDHIGVVADVDVPVASR